MPTDFASPRTSGPTRDPMFLRLCAVASVLGYLAMIAGNVIGSIVVPGHDVVADTISDLGAGRYEYIQDYAFYLYAAGVIALALALAHDHRGGWEWTGGILAMATIGALVVVIGARNEYGDGDDDGVVIHIYLVYGLALMLLAAPLLLSRGLACWSAPYRTVALGFAGLWLLASPVFFFLPTGFDGAYERGLGLVATLWMATVSLGVWRHAELE